MFDIEVDKDLDVVFESSGDVAVVREQPLNQQRLRVMIIAEYDKYIGELGTESIARKIELSSQRIASDLEFVEQVDSIEVEPSGEDANTVTVRVLYSTGQEFLFDI
jgi:hypothetical protein